MRAVCRATLVVVALAAGALAPVASASAQQPADSGSVSIRLLDAPTERRDDPRAQVYIVDHLAPGTTIERRVEIGNDTPATTDIELFAGGADVDDSVFTFFDGREGNELTDWTSVEPTTVTIPAGGTAQATVRIDVPDDASEGERYAVVWAELPPADDGDITLVNRVGVRIYLSVGPGGEPPSDFSIDGLTASRTDEGIPQLVAAVTNTGGRALDLTGELALSDGPGGVSAGPFPAQLGTTLGVGESGHVRLELDPALPDGPWQADLDLQAGRTEHSLSDTIDFSRDSNPLPRWLVAVASLLLLLLIIGLLVAVRHRRATPDNNAPTPPLDRDREPTAYRRLQPADAPPSEPEGLRPQRDPRAVAGTLTKG